jgi:DNA modification methylase
MNAGLGSMYSNAYEEIFFLAKLPPRTGLKSTTKRGERVVHSSNIVRYPRVQGAERLDNAAKPVEMIKGFIENSTDKGEVVLDLFGGSGTTLIACEMIERRCRMVEIEPRKVDGIVLRWEKRTNQKAKRIPA